MEQKNFTPSPVPSPVPERIDRMAVLFNPSVPNPLFRGRPHERTNHNAHDRLQAHFGTMTPPMMGRMLHTVGIKEMGDLAASIRCVLEKPVTVSKYHQGNLWRMDAVIERPGLHVIVEIKPRIDSMGELLGQCQRYMRHYRPNYLQDGEFCPVLIACPFIPDWIVEVIEAQGFYWLANERWDAFWGRQR
jgi:hypothetical protein